MLHIDYSEYLDRVYGCWLGKCVAGTIGAPYEGMKELLSFEYDPCLAAKPLPNDDLDLQVLWLSVLEEKGTHFTSDDLAQAFVTKCPYAPGEYAIFKKNYKRGIRPPLSGQYNNRYYIEGMGCPIRSEIWACISPGNPDLAAECAGKDGILDHSGNSVYAEQFLAGLEAAAFFESDLDKLVDAGLALVPADSRFAQLVRDVREWCRVGSDWKYVRGKVLRKYGHPDCTNMFQNMGIALLALYLGEMDFIKTTMIALNCGFDTDCTCASVGSVLGIISGADCLLQRHGFVDYGFILEVDVKRRSNLIRDLAEDTALMGVHFAEHLNPMVLIDGAPRPPVIADPPFVPIAIDIEYRGIPAIGIGDSRRVVIHFENRTECTLPGVAAMSIPDGWTVDRPSVDLDLAPGKTTSWEAVITVPQDIDFLRETNICGVSFSSDGAEAVTRSFGLIGAAVWEVFGPFWQNNIDMPKLALGDSYYKYIHGGNDNEYADAGRTYHLNTRVDLQKEYMSLSEIENPEIGGDAAREAEVVNIYEDLFSMNDLIGFQGPCAVYMVRRMISPEDRKVGIQIGHTDAYKLWVNGELVSERDCVDWWTCENVHLYGSPIRKGVNTFIVRLSRRSARAEFSLTFTTGGSCTEQYGDFASVNPKCLKLPDEHVEQTADR